MAEEFDPKKHHPDPDLLKRYIQELKEVVVYYRKVTTNTGEDDE